MGWMVRRGTVWAAVLLVSSAYGCDRLGRGGDGAPKGGMNMDGGSGY